MLERVSIFLETSRCPVNKSTLACRREARRTIEKRGACRVVGHRFAKIYLGILEAIGKHELDGSRSAAVRRAKGSGCTRGRERLLLV